MKAKDNDILKSEDKNKTAKTSTGGDSLHSVVMCQDAEEYDLWLCCSCEDSEPMERKDMLKHMESVHKITTKEGTRSILVHMDGTNFYIWKYEWEIEGYKFIQETRCKRERWK